MNEGKEQWEELEEEDSRLIVRNDLFTQVYHFKQGGKDIYDYTLNGWTRLANENQISIIDCKVEDLDKVYRATVVARRHEWHEEAKQLIEIDRIGCLLYTSPSPRDS